MTSMLRLHPYDDTAPGLTGIGPFVQSCAVDRYQVNSDGRMYFGETLWDFMDMVRSVGLVPRDDRRRFRLLMRPT